MRIVDLLFNPVFLAGLLIIYTIFRNAQLKLIEPISLTIIDNLLSEEWVCDGISFGGELMCSLKDKLAINAKSYSLRCNHRKTRTMCCIEYGTGTEEKGKIETLMVLTPEKRVDILFRDNEVEIIHYYGHEPTHSPELTATEYNQIFGLLKRVRETYQSTRVVK